MSMNQTTDVVIIGGAGCYWLMRSFKLEAITNFGFVVDKTA